MPAVSSKKALRQQQIMAELANSPIVRISQLAERFGVSTETARRDIEELSQRGVIDRTYGGAATRYIGFQPAVSERDRHAVDERRRIGHAAAALVKPGDVVMIDSGSTTTQFARALAGTLSGPITVLTNSLSVATTLVDIPSVRVILCPGDLNGRERGNYGADTVSYIGRYYADLAFIGASGLTVDGPTDVESRACSIKRAMVDRARQTLLLVDSSKFDQKHLEVVCPLSRISELITDAAPKGRLAKAIAQVGMTVRIAE
jgi:DeoR/GlpR family transcriptional regulator of sugar metabolism